MAAWTVAHRRIGDIFRMLDSEEKWRDLTKLFLTTSRVPDLPFTDISPSTASSDLRMIGHGRHGLSLLSACWLGWADAHQPNVDKWRRGLGPLDPGSNRSCLFKDLRSIDACKALRWPCVLRRD